VTRNFPGGDFDLSGLDPPPSPFEIGACLDAAAEYDAEMEAGAYDADQSAAAWVNGMSDGEFSELLAQYESDAVLPGPELAGAGSEATYDLANQMDAIDMMLAAQTGRESHPAGAGCGRDRAAGQHRDAPHAGHGQGAGQDLRLRPGTGRGPG
jgi:hypothetical protein